MGDNSAIKLCLQVQRRLKRTPNPLNAGVMIDGRKTLDSGFGFVRVIHLYQGVEIGITAWRNGDDFLFLVKGRTGPKVELYKLLPYIQHVQHTLHAENYF